MIPFNVLDVLESGGLRFSLSIDLFKKHEYTGDHRKLTEETDVFFKRVARSFDVWKTNKNHLSNSCLRFESGTA